MKITVDRDVIDRAYRALYEGGMDRDRPSALRLMNDAEHELEKILRDNPDKTRKQEILYKEIDKFTVLTNELKNMAERIEGLIKERESI